MSNLEFYDDYAERAVHMDVKLFKEAGGGTIVENSSHGLKRDIPLMRNVSQSMEVNVIAGTGIFFTVLLLLLLLFLNAIYIILHLDRILCCQHANCIDPQHNERRNV